MLIAIAILLSYSIAIVVAGHGALPMGIALIAGLFAIGKTDFSWGIAGIIVGWLGVLGLIFTTFQLRSNPSKQLNYQFPFCIVLYLSWLGLAISGNGESGSLFSSFVLSVPFQIVFLVVAGWFIFQRFKTNTDSAEMN